MPRSSPLPLSLFGLLLLLIPSLAATPAQTPSDQWQEGFAGRWLVLSDPSRPATRPALASGPTWTAVAWIEAEPEQPGALRLQLLRNLSPVWPEPLTLAEHGVRETPAAVWTGNGFVVAWVEESTSSALLRAARLPAGAESPRPARTLRTAAPGALSAPRLAALADHLGLLVVQREPEGASQLIGAWLDKATDQAGPFSELARVADGHAPAVTASGEQLMLAWAPEERPSSLRLARWLPGEPAVAFGLVEGEQPMRSPALAADISTLTLAWHEGDERPMVRAQLLDASGAPLGPRERLPGSEYARDPVLLRLGQETLLVFESGIARLGRMDALGRLTYPLQWLNFRDGYAARGMQLASTDGQPLLAWSDLSFVPWRVVLFRPHPAPSFAPPSGGVEGLELPAASFSSRQRLEPPSCAQDFARETGWRLATDIPSSASSNLGWEGSRGVPTTAHLLIAKDDGPPGNVALQLELAAFEPGGEEPVSRYLWTHPTYLIEAGCAARAHTIPISGFQIQPGEVLTVKVTRLPNHPLDTLQADAQLLGVRLLVRRDQMP